MEIKSIIKKIQERTLRVDMSNFSWGEGVALWGFNHSLKAVQCDKYMSFLTDWVEKGVANNDMRFTVNNSIPCVGIGEVYKAGGNPMYLEIIKKQADFLLKDAPRLKNGAIIHTDPNAQFGRQMWADTVFMAGLFLAYTGEMTGNADYTEEALRQFVIHAEVLQAEDGILYHGWDENKNDYIGCKWGRANAWLTVGVMDMLDYLPKNEILASVISGQLDAVARYQTENGLWRTVLDGKFSYLEASSAYGFGYGILKGIRLGILDEKYLKIEEKMRDTLINNVDDEGMVHNISAGTPVMQNEAEYQIICQHRIQTWGQGLALMYFTELEKIL